MSSTIDIVNNPSSYTRTNDRSFTNSVTDSSGSDILSKPLDSNKTTMNISKTNVYADCHQKCSYNFNYSNTLLIVKNNQTELLFSCEKSKTSSVTYNTNEYNVSSFSLYAPSLHQFNGNKVDGEIIIEHIPIYGGKNLYTCIPILKTNYSTAGSDIITEIIKETAKSAPGQGDIANLTISSFNLQSIVPRQPFYSYSGEGTPYKGDFIAFDRTNSIMLTQQTLSLLTSLLKPSYIIMSGGYLYYNPEGPNQTDSDIYISCQPTGSSNEPTDSSNTSSTSSNNQNNDLSEIFNNEWFMMIIIAIVFIFVILSLNDLFNVVG